MTLCLMLLVMGSALYLEPVTGAMADFASAFSTAAGQPGMFLDKVFRKLIIVVVFCFMGTHQRGLVA